MKGLENKAKKLKDLRMKPLIIKPLKKGLENKASKLKDLRMKPLIIGLEIKAINERT
jgi:hypothetical protein